MTCFQYRLGRIAKALSTDTVPTVTLRPPNEALVIDLGWAGTVPPLIAAHYDISSVEDYANASLWADSLRRAQSTEAANWRDLGRLSPSLGGVTQEDRLIAKGALIGATQSLRNVQYAATHLSNHAATFKVSVDVSELAGYRADKDICVAAMGYSLDAHKEAAQAGRLVTGEAL